MREGLFRKEAVEFATQRLYGHIIVLPKVSHVLSLVFVALCIALLAATLLVGQRVEQQTIEGELRFLGDGSAVIDLPVPPPLAPLFRRGDKLSFTASGFDPDSVGRIAARVARVSDERAIHQPREALAGGVHVPVTLTIDSAALDLAGLPRDANTRIAVETRVVVRRESWMRWLLRALGAGDSSR